MSLKRQCTSIFSPWASCRFELITGRKVVLLCLSFQHNLQKLFDKSEAEKRSEGTAITDEEKEKEGVSRAEVGIVNQNVNALSFSSVTHKINNVKRF